MTNILTNRLDLTWLLTDNYEMTLDFQQTDNAWLGLDNGPCQQSGQWLIDPWLTYWQTDSIYVTANVNWLGTLQSHYRKPRFGSMLSSPGLNLRRRRSSPLSRIRGFPGFEDLPIVSQDSWSCRCRSSLFVNMLVIDRSIIVRLLKRPIIDVKSIIVRLVDEAH